jgi:hypothetical protein
MTIVIRGARVFCLERVHERLKRSSLRGSRRSGGRMHNPPEHPSSPQLLWDAMGVQGLQD